MGNINNYNHNKLDFRLSNSEYWDFYLNTDAIKNGEHYTTNNIVSFDFSQIDNLSLNADFFLEDFFSNDFDDIGGITSLSGWSGYVSSNFSATTFGLTGLDNGYMVYDESLDDDAHTTLLNTLTGTTLIHSSGDTKLHLKGVEGFTGVYDYLVNLVINTGSTGNYIDFCGGFFQGHYKIDGFDYQTLPTRYEKGWTIASWLRPSDCASGHTLNDDYSGNTGFFYYTGTRAENKFWNVFSGNNETICTSGSSSGSTFCMDVKETDVMINNIIVEGILSGVNVPLSPPPIDVKLVENQFLIFGRSNGKVCGNGDSDDGFGQQRADQTWTGDTAPVLELDKDDDIVDNALGFRIKDDGSIGYRLLTLSADCKTTIMDEEYSVSGMVKTDQWNYITVKWVNDDNFNECDLKYDEPRKGRYKFYVDANLKFVSKSLNELIPKRLNEIQEKQVGVPYSVSIGGGTQGLLESITFDGQDADDLGLKIESNFAGSFIGSMSTFNLFDKNLSWCEIKDIYNSTKDKYK